MPRIKKSPEQERSETITKRLKIALFEKGWTQEHLAKITGYDRAKINRIINNPLNHDLCKVLFVSDKLNVKILCDEVCKR